MSKVTTTFEAVDQGMVATIKKIESETKSMTKSVEKAGQGMDLSFGSMAKAGASFAVGLGAVSAAIGAFKIGVNLLSTGLQAATNYIISAVSSSSDLQETTSKVSVIFADGAKEIEAWSKTAADGFGQSQNQAMGAAANFAIFGKSAGLSGQELTRFSTDLVELAADLASFNNTSQDEAIMAVGAALRGEAEPMRRFGVALDEMTMKNQALKMGLIETTTGALTPQQKALVATALMFKSTSDAQGDYVRTSDGLANSTKSLSAKFADFKTSIGDAVMPVVSELFSSLKNNLLPAMDRLKGLLSQVDLTGFGKGLADGALKFGDFLIGAILNAKQILPTIELGLVMAAKGFGNILLNVITGSGSKMAVILATGFLKAANSLKAHLFETAAFFSILIVDGLVAASGIFGDFIAEKAQKASSAVRESLGQAALTYSKDMDESNAKMDKDLVEMMATLDKKKPKDYFGAGETKSEMDLIAEKFVQAGKDFRASLKTDTPIPIMLQGVMTPASFQTSFAPPMLQTPPPMNVQGNQKKGAYTPDKEAPEFKAFFAPIRKSSNFLDKLLENAKTFQGTTDKLNQKMINAKVENMTKGTELEQQFNEQLLSKKFKQAENTIAKIEKEKEENAIRINEKGEKDRRSLQDIAKEMGIDTFRKSKSELRKEILEKKTKEEAKKAGVDKEPKKEPMSLLKVVELIKDTVSKIEPKLPTHALGL